MPRPRRIPRKFRAACPDLPDAILAALLGVDPAVAYRWLVGQTSPSPLARRELRRHLVTLVPLDDDAEDVVNPIAPGTAKGTP